MHGTDGFVRRKPRLGVGDFVTETLLSVGDAVGKDDADALVEIESTLGRAADVQMDEVAEDGAVCCPGFVARRNRQVFHDGAGRVAPLADERLGAGLHAG